MRKLHTAVSYSIKYNFTVSVTAVTGGLDSPSTIVWLLLCQSPAGFYHSQESSHDRTFYYRFNNPAGSHCCSVFGMLSLWSPYAYMYSFEIILIKDTTCNNSTLTFVKMTRYLFHILLSCVQCSNSEKSVIQPKTMERFIWSHCCNNCQGNIRICWGGWRRKLTNVTQRDVNKILIYFLIHEYPFESYPIHFQLQLWLFDDEVNNLNYPTLLHKIIVSIKRLLVGKVTHCALFFF